MATLMAVVAAGSGRRIAAAQPKALVSVAGRPLLAWTLEALRQVPFARMVVAAPPDRLEDFRRIVGGAGRVVAGGATRAASVRRTFAALSSSDDDIVVIHDGARPFVSAGEIEAVLRSAEETGAAIAAVGVVDTIKRVSEGRIVETLDRSTLYGAATPQAFRASVLRRALASGEEATDEAALCERLGIPVAIVPVSRLVFKITTPEDLALAEAIVARRNG